MFSKIVQAPIERVVLRHHPDRTACHGRRFDHIDPRDAHLARSRQSAGRADTDGCRLARAVRPEQAKKLPLPNAEVDAIDRDHTLLAVIDLLQTCQSRQSLRVISPRRIFDYMHRKQRSDRKVVNPLAPVNRNPFVFPYIKRITILPKWDADSICRNASRT